MRRPQATPESKARAERIARSLAGLLDDVPAPASASTPRGMRSSAAPDHGDHDDHDELGEGMPRGPAPGEALGCPRCAGTMETVAAAHGVEIDQCLECGAIWLDAGELEALVADQEPTERERPTMGALRARMREVLPSEGAVKYKDCPRCLQVMRRTNFGTISGVVVDECVQHGVLLDPGELQAIEAFIRMGGRPLGEEVRLEHGQRVLAPAPPPPPPQDTVQAYERRQGVAALETIWHVLFRW